MDTKTIIEEYIRNHGGIVRTAELLELGIDYRKILALNDEGFIERAKSGYYSLSSDHYSEEDMIISLFPDGVLTMESALFAYGYLSERPYFWSIGISKNTSKSRFKIDYPMVTPYYTEPPVLEIGVSEINLGNGKMKIYSKDRLICEVLKYEEKLTRDDFKKAAWAYIQDSEKDIGRLMEYAAERKVLKKVQTMIGVWL